MDIDFLKLQVEEIVVKKEAETLLENSKLEPLERLELEDIVKAMTLFLESG